MLLRFIFECMILEVVISNSHFIIISMCRTMLYVIDTIQVFFQSVLLQPLVRKKYKLSETKPRTLWKKKRVQVSDLYDNNWQLFL